MKLDDSQTGQTIGSDGCSLACLAMILTLACQNMNMVDVNGNPVTYTPSTLNNLMNITPGCAIMDANGNCTGYKLQSLLDTVSADSFSRDATLIGGLSFSPSWEWIYNDVSGGQSLDGALQPGNINSAYMINFALQMGMPTEVRVANNTHSLLVVGYNYALGFMVVDPAAKNPQLVPFSSLYQYNNTIDGWDQFYLVNVPEPSILAMLGIGAVSLLAYNWRRQRAKA